METETQIIKRKLTILSFLEYAVWGSYLTSVGVLLSSIGLGPRIGWFFAAQGVISIFMPSLVGIIADRWGRPQRMLAICHLLCAAFMSLLGVTVIRGESDFSVLFTLYCAAVAFFMPTVSLSNAVSFSILRQHGLDPVVTFPPIRTWGTVGFIAAMWIVNFLHIKTSGFQFLQSAAFGILLALFTLSLPMRKTGNAISRSFSSRIGLDALQLLRRREMAMFFVFAMLISICLQITNAYATPFLESFAVDVRYAGSWFVRNSIVLLSLSQISEALCFLLIPFVMKRYGIKVTILIAITAWMFRFALLGAGDPSGKVWMFILSMIVYGVAFDFFNIAGALYVEQNSDDGIKASAQGLLMMVNNGIATIVGMLSSQTLLNVFTHTEKHGDKFYTLGDWSSFWYVCAAFALLVAVLFAILFQSPGKLESDGD